MVELLKFEFYRIYKSVFIWIMAALAAIIPILTVIVVTWFMSLMGVDANYLREFHLTASNVKFANWYVISSLYERLPLIIALFVPLYLGRDYKDGFIRNKITAGHTRMQIYSAAAVTQVSVTLALSVIYILFAVISLALSPFGVNLNGGEMIVRAFTLILSLCSTTLLFCALSFVIKSRAVTVVLAIVFIFANNIFAVLSTNYTYNRQIIHEYAELYNEAGEMLDYEFEQLDEDDYFNVGWYIGHPIFLLTNSSLGYELMPKFSIITISSADDMFSYSNKVYRDGFANPILSLLGINNYMTYMIDSDDIYDIDGVEVKVSQVELEYNVKSICWGIIYFAGGYALFRKKNIS